MTQDLYPSRLAPKPDWQPRIDPVAHTEWSANAPLVAAQQAAFNRDGYLVLNGVLGGQEVERLQSELDRMRRMPASLDTDTLIAEPDSGALRSVFAIHRQNALFARLAS